MDRFTVESVSLPAHCRTTRRGKYQSRHGRSTRRANLVLIDIGPHIGVGGALELSLTNRDGAGSGSGHLRPFAASSASGCSAPIPDLPAVARRIDPELPFMTAQPMMGSAVSGHSHHLAPAPPRLRECRSAAHSKPHQQPQSTGRIDFADDPGRRLQFLNGSRAARRNDAERSSIRAASCGRRKCIGQVAKPAARPSYS